MISKSCKLSSHHKGIQLTNQYEKSYEMRKILRGKEKVSLAGGNFAALIYVSVLQRVYIVLCDADNTGFSKLDTPIIKQYILTAAIVIDAVKSR